jgi:ComF family protein
MMRSWAVFDSPVQNALLTIKYRRNIGLGDSIAVQMAEFARSLGWAVDLLVPAPLGRERLSERGYNQVGLVARPLAYELGWEYEPKALRKIRETRSQVGLTASQRRENVSKAYQADPVKVNGKNVLLMDDVSTTGSTITSCVEALLSAGAREVYALTIARALAHHDLQRV